ncbi:unnamed protein product [Tenebrio molitor]|nr:unnamed protein product [Tenebrio molitor]
MNIPYHSQIQQSQTECHISQTLLFCTINRLTKNITGTTYLTILQRTFSINVDIHIPSLP